MPRNQAPLRRLRGRGRGPRPTGPRGARPEDWLRRRRVRWPPDASGDTPPAPLTPTLSLRERGAREMRGRQILGEALQGACPAALVLVAARNSLEDRLIQGELRLIPAFGEGHRHQGLVAGFALRIFPGKSKYEALRLDHLAVDALLPILGSLGGAHAEAKGAARPDVHIAISRDEALRPPPARDTIGLGPRLEYQTARRIEDASDDELALSSLCDRASPCVHVSPPALAARRGSRPGDRGSRPKTADNAPANRRHP